MQYIAKKIIKNTVFFIVCSIQSTSKGFLEIISLPEIYQDITIDGQVVKQGVRSCQDRYEAIKPILNSLPKNSKALDIGASQGYFSFKMAAEFDFRCCMIEGGYKITNQVWKTGDFLHYLCEKNCKLKDITLLQHQFSLNDLKELQKAETFDVVIAFSVIHHMRESLLDPMEQFTKVIDSILELGDVVLIENPINTGDHTLFIQDVLKSKGGQVIYQSFRGTLIYEMYLFDQRTLHRTQSILPHIKKVTYEMFNGTYSSTEV